jgi:RNA polymerase sigma-70 factor, ECF subfamily
MEKPWEVDLSVYDDEEALLAGLRRRDRLACTCLLKRFAPRLYRLALGITANPDEAEDVLQEGFIQACGKIDQFEGRSSLGTWLHRIVRNAALMRLRRRSPDLVAYPEGSPAELAPLPPPLIDRENDPGAQALQQEQQALIEEAILALPDTLRVAFTLRDIEGLSTSEAARSLGISESALKVRLHRARLALRASLAPYIEEDQHHGT